MANHIHRILEIHSKTVVTFGGWFISVFGWFLWLIALAGLYREQVGIYIVRDAFLYNFGRQLLWWLAVLLELAVLIVIDLAIQSIRRVYWPTDQDLMQRIEKDGQVESVFEDYNLEEGRGEDDVVTKQSRRDAAPQETRG